MTRINEKFQLHPLALTEVLVDLKDELVSRVLDSKHSLGVGFLRASALVVNVAGPTRSTTPTVTGNQNVVSGTSVSYSINGGLRGVLPVTD